MSGRCTPRRNKLAGHQKVTADAVVGVADKPVRLYSLVIRSKVSGSGIVILRNGSDTSGTEFTQLDGVAGASTPVSFGEQGKFFPGGLYVDIDADVEYADVDYEQVQS